jgi:hypothetical protein
VRERQVPSERPEPNPDKCIVCQSIMVAHCDNPACVMWTRCGVCDVIHDVLRDTWVHQPVPSWYRESA